MTSDNHMGIDLAVIDGKYAPFWHAAEVIARDEYGRSTQGPVVENVPAAAQDLGADFALGRSLLGSLKLACDLPRRIVELSEASP